MKKLILLTLVFGILTTHHLTAQTTDDTCACCSENYTQFDFWIGEWDVYDVNDKLVGTNTITKQYDNCLVQEKWISKGKNRGTSYNYFDKTDKTWNQVWVDNTGYVLNLKGNFKDGAMILKSDLIEGKKEPYYNQISWTKNNDGTVTQLWEIFDRDANKISEVFHGIYKKRLN